MSLLIHGIGTANPPDPISLADSIAVAKVLADPKIAHWVEEIYTGTGVQSRFMVHGNAVVRDIIDGTQHTTSPFLLHPDRPHGPTTGQRMEMYAQYAPPMAIAAARQAFERSEISPKAITHLVTVSCTGFVSPGVEFHLMKHLKLRPTVERVNVGFMGCHGAINGLRVCHAIAAANPHAHILMVCAELCSLHYYYGGDPGKLIANALFADGAAAIVATGNALEPEHQYGRVRGTGSCLIPGSEQEMGWKIGDHGFEMVLTKKVPRVIAQNVRPFLEEFLANFGLDISEVGSWGVHPGGPKVLSSVEEGLGLPSGSCAVSHEVLANYGNMSSPTVLFILEKLKDAPRPTVLLGFGPGLVAEAALVG
jgi:predicted naringenin-chalcone synthase